MEDPRTKPMHLIQPSHLDRLSDSTLRMVIREITLAHPAAYAFDPSQVRDIKYDREHQAPRRHSRPLHCLDIAGDRTGYAAYMQSLVKTKVRQDIIEAARINGDDEDMSAQLMAKRSAQLRTRKTISILLRENKIDEAVAVARQAIEDDAIILSDLTLVIRDADVTTALQLFGFVAEALQRNELATTHAAGCAVCNITLKIPDFEEALKFLWEYKDIVNPAMTPRCMVGIFRKCLEKILEATPRGSERNRLCDLYDSAVNLVQRTSMMISKKLSVEWLKYARETQRGPNPLKEAAFRWIDMIDKCHSPSARCTQISYSFYEYMRQKSTRRSDTPLEFYVDDLKSILHLMYQKGIPFGEDGPLHWHVILKEHSQRNPSVKASTYIRFWKMSLPLVRGIDLETMKYLLANLDTGKLKEEIEKLAWKVDRPDSMLAATMQSHFSNNDNFLRWKAVRVP